MIRVNLAAKNPCPSCGADTEEGFDGGTDAIFECCDRRRTLLRGPALRRWWEEHARHCHGCDGAAGPAEWSCDFYASPPRWLAAALERPAD